ncbi:MAG: DUF1365 domain-containing protein [Wenzhouxiangella sp.]
MDSAVAVGVVRHRRRAPREHRFAYRVFYSLLDLAELDRVFAASRWWSLERGNLVSFRRADYFGDPRLDLDVAVRERVERDTGYRPTGRILLLTHLRQWGFCFNPVSFYFCLDASKQLEFIVADIHNTPWNQRHAYVLDCRQQAGPDYRFEFAKAFHVSPFLPMQLDYDWRFRFDSDRIRIHMLVMDGDTHCFAAGMDLQLEPLTTHAMRKMPLQFPLLTLRVVAAIYWQALRLWIKRVPFHSHPDKQLPSP